MDITIILKLIIELIVAIIGIFIIPYIKNKYSETQLNTAKTFIEIAVNAAEQLFNSSQGTEKRAYVIKQIESKGIKIDYIDLDNIIESSVLKLHSELYGATKSE